MEIHKTKLNSLLNFMKDRYPQLDITKARFEDKDNDSVIDPEELVGFGSFKVGQKELPGYGSFKVADEIRAYQRYLDLNKTSLQTYLDARKHSGLDMLIVRNGVFMIPAGPGPRAGIIMNKSKDKIIVASGVFKDSTISLIMTNGGSFPDPIGAQLESGSTVLDCSPKLSVKLDDVTRQKLNKALGETLSAALAVNNMVKTLVFNTDNDPQVLNPLFFVLPGLGKLTLIPTIEVSQLNDATVDALETFYNADPRRYFKLSVSQSYSVLSPASFTKLSKIFSLTENDLSTMFKNAKGKIVLETFAKAGDVDKKYEIESRTKKDLQLNK